MTKKILTLWSYGLSEKREIYNYREAYSTTQTELQNNMVKHIILWTLKPELSEQDKAVIKAYAVHPAHQAVVNTKVHPYTAVRSCLDYEI